MSNQLPPLASTLAENSNGLYRAKIAIQSLSASEYGEFELFTEEKKDLLAKIQQLTDKNATALAREIPEPLEK